MSRRTNGLKLQMLNGLLQLLPAPPGPKSTKPQLCAAGEFEGSVFIPCKHRVAARSLCAAHLQIGRQFAAERARFERYNPDRDARKLWTLLMQGAGLPVSGRQWKKFYKQRNRRKRAEMRANVVEATYGNREEGNQIAA